MKCKIAPIDKGDLGDLRKVEKSCHAELVSVSLDLSERNPQNPLLASPR